MQQPRNWKLLQIMKSITQKREKKAILSQEGWNNSPAKSWEEEEENQVRAVGGERIMWQLEDKVKELELQAARDEELKKQFKAEKM